MSEHNIKIGDYIVIQRQNYKKLHKFNKTSSCVSLGRDSIELTGIEGCEYFSSFKMLSKGGKRTRIYSLELTNDTKDLKEILDIKGSGTDNRNIIDDGRSQKLSAAEIEDLKNDAISSSDIVSTLISNSNTFHAKTEFSQDKYLKKKEKKYFEYLQIRKPNLRHIVEIMYRLDPAKIQGLRIDTLSQIMTVSNISAEGNHLLYDSGSNGLMSAALLSAIGPNCTGKLIHMHPGNMSQKQALLAMNFGEEQLSRCVSVNIYSILRQFYQGCYLNGKNNSSGAEDCESAKHHDGSLKRSAQDEEEVVSAKHPKLNADVLKEVECNEDPVMEVEENVTDLKTDTPKLDEPKKPKWHFDNIAASEILKDKMDSLVIACKEDPLNIFNELVKFVKPGRPFVIYYNVAEPLQNCYTALRGRSDVAALKLTCNWMRNYQVLPERTHPEVTMNGSSGFLLSGYVLK